MSSPFYDKNGGLLIARSGFLPHWHQSEKMQFVTFRLIDSLPQTKIKELKAMREEFENAHPKPWDDEVQNSYHSLISRFESNLLDNGHGSCLLSHTGVRQIVEDAISHLDNEQYIVYAFVIMPNHVHLLCRLIGPGSLMALMHTIKGYTGKKINALLGRTGALWMRDYHDTMIRSEAHFRRCIEYIISNPRYLPCADYTLYVHPDHDPRR